MDRWSSTPLQPSLVVRNARTLALRQRLSIGPPFSQQLAADIPEGSTLVAPDGRTVYYAYWLLDAEGQPVAGLPGPLGAAERPGARHGQRWGPARSWRCG